ncbi:PadR family transcriptional regulator [Streptomyces sp. NPDC088925]|uniref:PadR family transcriptional regulator n=1 Tax=Streptomyces sp. NPDC088925 TaxID=3365914 RepID=UPI00381C91D4
MPRRALDHPLVPDVLGLLLEGDAHPHQLLAALQAGGEARASVAHRGTVYNTVTALAAAGLIAPLGREREGNRPERTVYTLTPEGRAELVRRIDAQIRDPRREFSRFLGAVAHLGALGPLGAASALTERAARLEARIDEDGKRLAAALAQGVPRLFVIEAEYALTLARAEHDWLRGLVEEISGGTLAWPAPATAPTPEESA